MTKRFTGWHMTAILVGFFSIVIAVNVYMAHAAISTFGGTVVDNSYVASQEFNGWLAAAKKQQQLGWKTGVSLDSRRHVRIAASLAGGAIEGLNGSGQASHPLGATLPITLTFSVAADGSLQSAQALPTGRWLVHAVLRSSGETVKLSTDVQ
ncbi:FixH family protein [Aquisediminimonas profunda]|uniref:FixH family protein n=1 Tax=Aquisediminimonas profunda TaxID=1550733 RepID=UPI001C638234|nr:FixH family protein [Aquisediminimonas profunda]